jgi:hypothetical protein
MKTMHVTVGRTPSSAPVPPDPLSEQADVGVGRGPGGPPHVAFKMFSRVRTLRGYCPRAAAPSFSPISPAGPFKLPSTTTVS